MEAIILIAVGIALFYFVYSFRQKTKKLSANGLEANGVVFDTVESGDINSRAMYPIIRFTTSKTSPY